MRNIPVFTFEKSQNQKEQKTAMLLYCRCLATHASDSPQGFMPIKASPPIYCSIYGIPCIYWSDPKSKVWSRLFDSGSRDSKILKTIVPFAAYRELCRSLRVQVWWVFASRTFLLSKCRIFRYGSRRERESPFLLNLTW